MKGRKYIEKISNVPILALALRSEAKLEAHEWGTVAVLARLIVKASGENFQENSSLQ